MTSKAHLQDDWVLVESPYRAPKKPATTESPRPPKSPEKRDMAKKPRRRLVPDLPAIEKFLKNDLGKEFAGGLKERNDQKIMNSTEPPEVPLDAFQAMLLADVKARMSKRENGPRV